MSAEYFSGTMRVYWPEPAMLRGAWVLIIRGRQDFLELACAAHTTLRGQFADCSRPSQRQNGQVLSFNFEQLGCRIGGWIHTWPRFKLRDNSIA